MSKPVAEPGPGPSVSPHDALEDWEVNREQLANPFTCVCGQCVLDPHLWASVAATASSARCDFCGTTTQTVVFNDLAEMVEAVLGGLYVTLEESSAYQDEGEWSETVADVQDVLAELLDQAVRSSVLAPLVLYVASRNAVEHGFVRRADLWGTLFDIDEGKWRTFMARARAGEVTASPGNIHADLADEILALFRRIETIAQSQELFKHSTPVLWRARSGVADMPHATGGALGSPPAHHVKEGGRLNAAGQSVFYGSTTLRGAAIEIANHYGHGVEIWAGKFTPTRELYHLDVMEPPDLPSPFASGAAETHQAVAFLVRFAETLCEPWQNDPKRYRPTQIFTSFLLSRHDECRPDAIRYASSLDPASENWAVFADNDHCGDVGSDARAYRDDGVRMLLHPATLRFSTAGEYL